MLHFNQVCHCLISPLAGEKSVGVNDDQPPVLKRSSSALNAAKLLKKTLSRHNLLSGTAEPPEAQAAHTPGTLLNGHSHSSHTLTNGHTHHSPEQEGGVGVGSEPDHQKHGRKKDSCSLATVNEETNGDGETEQLTGDRYYCVPTQQCENILSSI